MWGKLIGELLETAELKAEDFPSEFHLTNEKEIVGRLPRRDKDNNQNYLSIPFKCISITHFSISRIKNANTLKYFLTNHSKNNGVYLNREHDKLNENETRELKDGDKLLFRSGTSTAFTYTFNSIIETPVIDEVEFSAKSDTDNDLRNQLLKKDEKIQVLVEELDCLDDLLTRSKNQKKDLEDKNDQLNFDVAELEGSIERKDSEISKLESENKDLKHKLEIVGDDIEKRFNGISKHIDNSHTRLIRFLDDAKSPYLTIKNELNKIKNEEKIKLINEVNNLKRELEESEKKNLKLLKEKEEIIKDLQESESLLRNELMEVKKCLEEKNLKLNKYENVTLLSNEKLNLENTNKEESLGDKRKRKTDKNKNNLNKSNDSDDDLNDTDDDASTLKIQKSKKIYISSDSEKEEVKRVRFHENPEKKQVKSINSIKNCKNVTTK